MKKTPKSPTEIVNNVVRADVSAKRQADAIARITSAFTAATVQPTEADQQQLVTLGVVARRFDSFVLNPLKTGK